MTSLADFFQELRRRKVYRATAWYAAAAFAIWQAADIAFPVLGFPPVAMTFVVVGAIAGFPLVIGLSWAYDLRRDSGSDEVRSGRRVAAVGVLAAVVTFAGLGLWVGSSPPASEPEDVSPATVEQITFSGNVGVFGHAPKLSPDGHLVAYRDLSQVGTLIRDLGSDAPPIRVDAQWGSFLWSADGSELLVVSGSNELHGRSVRGVLAFPRLGGSGRVVIERVSGGSFSLENEADEWVAGEEGRCLYRVIEPSPGEAAVVCEHLDGRGGADTSRIVLPAMELDIRSVAPDGRRVLATVPDSVGALYLLSSQGEEPRRILDRTPGGFVWSVVWARPDRAYVARDAPDGVEILALEIAGSRGRMGTRRLWATTADLVRFDVSADGTRLVYQALEERSNIRLYSAGSGGLRERRALTRGTAHNFQPAVDPTSPRVAFVRHGHEIRMIPDSGGPAETLATFRDARVYHLAWSADGRRLAFLIADDSTEDLGLLEVDSRRLTRIPSPLTNGSAGLAWAGPDVLLLEYDRDGDDPTVIHRMARDAAADTIASARAGHHHQRDMAVSPDGRWVAVRGLLRYDSLLLVATDGSTSRAVGPEEYGKVLAWMPGDTLILRSSYRPVGAGFTAELVKVDAWTGRLLGRFEHPGCYQLSFGPDGRMACTNLDQARDLWLVDGLGG